MMDKLPEMALVALLMTDLALVSSSRIMQCIKLMAFQGLLVGSLPVLSAIAGGHLGGEVLAVAFVNIAVKCLVLPYFLSRSLRLAGVRREVEPYIGFAASILVAVAAVAVAFMISSRLPLPKQALSPLSTPVALSSIFIGLFVIVSRRKAITQAIGFLAFENGIYVFGNGLLVENGLVVELGILLDVLVLIFVMGIAVFQISRGFEHIDSDRMRQLGDWDASSGKGSK